MLIVQFTGTATNSDVLSGTDLANIPRDGQLDIFAASTQNDTTLTVTGPDNEPIIRGQKLLLRTNGMPSLKDDVPMSMFVTQGGHYIVNMTIVTAATVAILFVFRDLEELV